MRSFRVEWTVVRNRFCNGVLLNSRHMEPQDPSGRSDDCIAAILKGISWCRRIGDYEMLFTFRRQKKISSRSGPCIMARLQTLNFELPSSTFAHRGLFSQVFFYSAALYLNDILFNSRYRSTIR